MAFYILKHKREPQKETHTRNSVRYKMFGGIGPEYCI